MATVTDFLTFLDSKFPDFKKNDGFFKIDTPSEDLGAGEFNPNATISFDLLNTVDHHEAYGDEAVIEVDVLAPHGDTGVKRSLASFFGSEGQEILKAWLNR